jgi:solute carrier family 39 (zinc transporter), member 9
MSSYVAMHAMQEDGNSSNHEHSPGGINGYGDGASSAQRKQKGPQMRDTVATVGGMLLPLLTQLFHHH